MTGPTRETGETGRMERPLKVLVVDDEEAITDLVVMALRYEGFDVHAVHSGQAALTRVALSPPDLLVLDVMLPDIDGFMLCQRLRGSGRGMPTLFLTARDATEDKVHGLTLGGDDYVTKPFAVSELVARVRAILRRAGAADSTPGPLRFSDLELDPETREVRRGGRHVELTATEYRLLHYLLANARKVLTRAQLLDHVWGHDFGGEARVLETYVSYLRRKIDPVPPSLIHTVRGVGYVLRLPR
ncbi:MULTISPECIES: response regulator transcription factor [Protofrankia]|uniref:Two component transcriptional regulator, winged helix family n=2 Tax=Frankiaceae TaxID=74712 RepID=F8AWA7_9ACTN|nr:MULTISPECIES: response regulator transcription factor [Protofrankia]AEH11440.1 two component transcriptional regulator, winged helix family [Candidatus Protofrankia datiscae]